MNSGNAWLEQWFSAKITQKTNGIIRRKIKDIEKFASLELTEREVKKRGWHMVEVGDQWIVICAPGSIRIVV